MFHVHPNSDLTELIQAQTVIGIVIPDSWQSHYQDSNIVALYLCNPKLNWDTVIPIDIVNEEPINFSLQVRNVITPDKRLFEKWFKVFCYDFNTLRWLANSNQNVSINFSAEYSTLLRHYNGENRYIPSVKHLEHCREVVEIIRNSNILSNKYPEVNFYNDTIYPAIKGIEQNTINVDDSEFVKYYGRKPPEKVRCYYNLHTLTGRPSNTFNNINLAALTKGATPSQRSFIIPTDESGMLVEYDFNAYHLFLIAAVIGYKLPPGNVHEYLGKQYFNKDTLTEEEYAESKSRTFRNLYSHYIDTDIPFFKKISEFRKTLWHRFNTQSFIKSFISGRSITKSSAITFNESKLFNYYIQAIETEFSMICINEVFELLEEKSYKSKIIMYTYDSFLLDYSSEDPLKVLEEIAETLTQSEFIPNLAVKLKAGKNYEDMHELVLN